jgi:hypothetical protein
MQHFFFSLLVCTIIYSCGSQKKIAVTQDALDLIKQGQEKETTKLADISGSSVAKVSEGKIDSNINNRITAVLKKYQDAADSAKQNASAIDSLLADKKKFRKNYKSLVLPLLDSLQEINAKYTDRLSVYLMVEEGLNIANYNLFDLAAFFGPGIYNIPEDKTDLALSSFAPIVDSLMIFSNKYSDRSRTASLVILGFADGAGFSSEGPLFDTLTSIIGRRDVAKEELNQKLSELRALELSRQLTKIFLQKAPAFKNFDNLKVEYIPQGKGEAYPLPSIKDYMVEDARRRIVLCYWVVLPG